MKKPFAVLFLLLLASCAKVSDLPPPPPAPGVVGHAFVGLAGAMPSWAAPPVGVTASPEQAFYGDGVLISVSGYDFVYKTAYLFNSQENVWSPFSLSGSEREGWLEGDGVGSFDVEALKFKAGENYAVVYACNRGSSDWDCNGGRWMLVKFNVASSEGVAPSAGDVSQFVIAQDMFPFTVVDTGVEPDNFEDVNVMRYDALYRMPTGLETMVHVFSFNSRADLEKTLHGVLWDIVSNGAEDFKGFRVAMFTSLEDHQIALWSYADRLVYIESLSPVFVPKELVEAYMAKYPSDLSDI